MISSEIVADSLVIISSYVVKPIDLRLRHVKPVIVISIYIILLFFSIIVNSCLQLSFKNICLVVLYFGSLFKLIRLEQIKFKIKLIA